MSAQNQIVLKIFKKYIFDEILRQKFILQKKFIHRKKLNFTIIYVIIICP